MSRQSTLFLLLLTLVMTAGCKGQGQGAEQSSRIDDAPSPAAQVLPSPYAFDVDVVLPEATRERLQVAKESVIVSASYFADGKQGLSAGILNDVGYVDVGRAQIELFGEGRAAFDGSAVLRERLDFIEGDLQLNVNVFSGRRSSGDNLLDCDYFQDTLRIAVAKPIRITCRMIAE